MHLGTHPVLLQTITLQTVTAATFANMGTQLALNNHPAIATALGAATAVCAYLVYRGYKRVQRLDKFERGIKGNR